MIRSITPCLALVLCLAALPALADEGRIPVWQSPTVITTPGRYIVTRDLAPPAVGAPTIEVAAPNVDLDLNGFNVSNGNAFPVIRVPNSLGVVIHNGTLLGGSRGIDVVGVGRSIVIDNIISENAGQGFRLDGVDEATITRNTVVDCVEVAIFWFGTPVASGSVDHNHIRRCGEYGIRVGAVSSLSIRHNRIEEIGTGTAIVGAGIQVSSGAAVLIEGNTIERGFVGIFLGNVVGSKLYNNVVSQATDSGIRISTFAEDNLLLTNVVTATQSGHGIVIEGDRNHVDGNLSNFNNGCGLWFQGSASSNVYRKNMARGNTCPAACATTDLCDAGAGNDTNLDNFLPFPGM